MQWSGFTFEDGRYHGKDELAYTRILGNNSFQKYLFQPLSLEAEPEGQFSAPLPIGCIFLMQ